MPTHFVLACGPPGDGAGAGYGSRMSADDQFAILRLLSVYATALDTLDIDRLAEVFTADARLEMGGAVMDLAEYQAMCRTNLARLDATQHVVTNPCITLAGDAATCRSYYTAQHAANRCDPPLALMGGWVDDALERRADGWRITARTWTSVWFDGNAEVLGMPLRRGAMRRRAGTD